ncbi:MAG: FAD-dependent oxidoreductase [Thiohalomonadaceae bacterium]
MAEYLDPDTKAQVSALLASLPAPVRLVYFTQAQACGACREQRELLETIAGLSDKVVLEVHDLLADAEAARTLGIDKVPATTVIGPGGEPGIRFYGLTAGYEFASLIEAITREAEGQSGLAPEVEALVRLIDVPVHLEVMVTLTCPFCPRAVHLAHQFALANPLIRADMVEAAEFPHLVQRYRVQGVPRTVINGVYGLEGALPAGQAVMEILRFVKPAVHERVEASQRELRGERRVAVPSPDHLFQTAIVGAGPAALTAALYAARKGLDVVLIGDHVGGQVADTATVENWPGVARSNGRELGEAFRQHAELYPVAERLHVHVTRMERTEDRFLLHIDGDERLQARTVIWCAGKQYRRLGVPGEERFIGRGIAFCATCDAPLYRDKRVAVVGGGNSAFTAVRDLLGFAREIHLVHIGNRFTADSSLQREVMATPRVTCHRNLRVTAFLGDEHLTGVRVQAVDDSERFDIAVDGVFLEIGLTPNAEPVRDLVALNAAGEIPVQRDQSTSLPGLFAAGDVTDEPEKQIVVAAGAGAKAALAVYRYLTDGPG